MVRPTLPIKRFDEDTHLRRIFETQDALYEIGGSAPTKQEMALLGEVALVALQQFDLLRERVIADQEHPLRDLECCIPHKIDCDALHRLRDDYSTTPEDYAAAHAFLVTWANKVQLDELATCAVARVGGLLRSCPQHFSFEERS